MDTEVKDPKELTVFAAFMTPQAPTEETLSTGDSGAPNDDGVQRRRVPGLPAPTRGSI